MTREEIERSFQYNMTDAFIKWDNAVNTEYKEENEEAFYQGAYAAQKYLIEKVKRWLKNNTDWVGTRVETVNEMESVNEFVEKLWNYLEEESYRLD
jgi:hypothetical protein